MDGATLLGHVEQSHPAAIRIVLSGSTEREVVMRAAAVAHRLLAKPCDVDELVRVVARSCALRTVMAKSDPGDRPIAASRLPAAPRLHRELTALLADGGATAGDAAAIIAQDLAMSAKVLQVVNSAFFGLRRQITDVGQAAVLLGLGTLRALVLSSHAFEKFQPSPPIEGFDLDALQRHCSQVARVARDLVPPGPQRDDAFVAALLHDVGLLVLATQERDYLAMVLERAQREHRPLFEIEQEERGVTHAEVGGQLLGVVGAAGRHRRSRHLPPPPPDGPPAPTRRGGRRGDRQRARPRVRRGAGRRAVSTLDQQYVADLGLAGSVAGWREVAVQVAAAS